MLFLAAKPLNSDSLNILDTEQGKQQVSTQSKQMFPLML
jgi:hypothetical protein